MKSANLALRKLKTDFELRIITEIQKKFLEKNFEIKFVVSIFANTVHCFTKQKTTY